MDSQLWAAIEGRPHLERSFVVAAAFVDITLDRPRRLIYDMEAMELLEAGLNGLPLRDVVDRLRGMSVPTLCIALWAGLKGDDKTITLNLTKKFVKKALYEDGRAYSELSDVVADALDKSGIFGSKDADPNETKADA